MSEENKTTVSIEQLKQTYGCLAFIHSKMMTTPFYLEEVAQADAATKFVIELANKIGAQIEELSPKPVQAEKVEDETANG